MNNLVTLKHNLAMVIVLFSTLSLVAQNKYKETFKVGDDALVSVNTSHTNVIFETWNKNVVEVEAFVDGDELTEKEKSEIFKSWDIDVLGNSKKVVITSNSGSLWGGYETLGSLDHLVELESLKELGKISSFHALENLNLEKMNLHLIIPDIPEFREVPSWPFSSDQPTVFSGNETIINSVDTNGAIVFDTGKYKKDKQAYVDKLNKNYNTKVSVKQVDAWLKKVDEWSEEFSEVMENWGENFGKEFEDKFGPEFEVKMEKWGVEFGKKMEAWGEKFEAEMEKWGEEYGKDIEKWGEEMEKWAEEFEKTKGNHTSKRVITTPNGDTQIILNENSHEFFEENHLKGKKTIIIRMPKGTKTDINVRHGEVKMADAYNIRATLDYSALSANSIDGGNTLINVSHAPIQINHWKQGELLVRYVDNCRINSVANITLKANSSDVVINRIVDNAMLTGSFGDLIINSIEDDFKTVNIFLENTDAKINLPKSAFQFDFKGKKTPITYPKTMKFELSKHDGNVFVKGQNKSTASDKKITINASYSNVKMQ